MAPHEESRHVFLTGATGFLGSHLLAQLLHDPSTVAFCLVRAQDAVAGSARIERAMRRNNLWRDDMAGRIVAETGDLEQPWLGLGRERFLRLGDGCDAVYHNGATVNYVLPYGRLQKANVQGTQEIIRLATRRRVPVNYVSTLRLFDARVDGIPIREDDPVDESQTMHSGYSQSKWMAEKLLRRAGAQGLPYTVFRPGLVCGAGEDGVSNEQDAVSLLMKACAQLQSAPVSTLQLFLTPVDFVVKALVWLSRQVASRGRTFHLVNLWPTPANELLQGLVDAGYALEPRPYRDWVTRARAAAAAGEALAMAPLLGYLTDELPEQSQRRIFDSRFTHERLAEAGLLCGALGAPEIRGIIRGMQRTGFLPASEEPAMVP